MIDAIGVDMVNYVVAAELIALGLMGVYGHYAKDRYLERKLDCSFSFYLANDTRSTYNMLKALFASSIPLAIAHSGGYVPSLSEVYGAFLAGYGADSMFNHAYPKRDDQ